MNIPDHKLLLFDLTYRLSVIPDTPETAEIRHEISEAIKAVVEFGAEATGMAELAFVHSAQPYIEEVEKRKANEKLEEAKKEYRKAALKFITARENLLSLTQNNASTKNNTR